MTFYIKTIDIYSFYVLQYRKIKRKDVFNMKNGGVNTYEKIKCGTM